MVCGEELDREPSPQTRSNRRLEASHSLFCGTRMESHQCQKIEVQNKEMLMVHQSAARPWQCWQLKRIYTSQDNKWTEPCRGLAPTIRNKGRDWQMSVKAPCSLAPRLGARGPMTNGMLCRTRRQNFALICGDFLLITT